MARFDNTNTTIKAVVIDIENMTKNEIEYTMNGYTRSNKRAEEIIREALGIEENALVKVTELVQDKDEPKSYNVGKLIHNGFEVLKDEPENVGDDFIVIDFPMYVYQANVFFEDANGNAVGTFFEAKETYQKFSKGNARDYILEEFEIENDACNVVAVRRHPERVLRKEETNWIVVNVDDAKNYEC